MATCKDCLHYQVCGYVMDTSDEEIEAPTAEPRWTVKAMAENYKRLYEQMKKMVAMYQDEVVPGLREQLGKRVEVVRCKACKHWAYDKYFEQHYCSSLKGLRHFISPNDYCPHGAKMDGGKDER